MNDRVESPAGPRNRGIDAVAVVALVWSLGVFGAFLYTAVARPDNFTGVYNASAYWVTYDDGFIRRGLIGSIAAAVLGHPLDKSAATVLGVLIFAVGFCALLWLTRIVVAAVERPVRLLAGAVVVASPFTFSLLVQTRGRYDAVLVACTVLIVVSFLAVSPRVRPWHRLLVVAVVNALAVGVSEFAFGFLAPLTLLGVLRMSGARLRGALLAAVALLPAAALAAASFLRRPRLEFLAELTERVRAAGLPLSSAQESSISALGQSAADALAFTARISPVTIAVCVVALGGCYVLSSVALWIYCGLSYRRTTFVLMAVYAAGALFLSAFADDYRRWWGLAFVAMTCSTLLLAAGNRSPARHSLAPRMPTRRTAAVLATVLLAASAAGQLFPLFPTWDEAADTNLSIDYLTAHR